MRGECTCWMPYPNELCRNADGSWKCVEEYENVRPLTGSYGRGKKTKCKRRSNKEIAVVNALLQRCYTIEGGDTE